MIQIAFFKGKRTGWPGLFDRAVRWYTGGPYSHCEIVLSTSEGLSWCASASKQDGGVRLKHMALPSDRWDILHAPYADPHAVAQWFASHTGGRYDTLGLFGFFAARGTQSPDRWFCSEACAAALGIPEPWRYCPNTLFSITAAAQRFFFARTPESTT